MFEGGVRGRPNDERGFIHKKLLRGLSTLTGIAGGLLPGPLAGVARTVSGLTGRLAGSRPLAPRIQTARVTQFSEAEKQNGALLKLGVEMQRIPLAVVRSQASSGPCRDPALIMAPDGHCVARGSGHFESHFGREEGGAAVPVGDAVMGRYGAALTPGSMIIDRAVCLKGMQLADDGLCYNKSQISNKQRMWPAGRKPLLSGGDMRAISIAARAGRRLEGATKRLQRLGMMKKPAGSRRISRQPHPALLVESSVQH